MHSRAYVQTGSRGNSSRNANIAPPQSAQSQQLSSPEKESATDRNPTREYSSDSDQAGKVKTDDTKYKTEMCKNFQATGNCNYGKKCRFAHGKTDLNSKPIQTSKSYKTKTCKAFHEDLSCPYGSRCLFKHDQRSVLEIFTSKFYSHRLALLTTSSAAAATTNTSTNTITASPTSPSTMISNNPAYSSSDSSSGRNSPDTNLLNNNNNAYQLHPASSRLEVFVSLSQ